MIHNWRRVEANCADIHLQVSTNSVNLLLGEFLEAPPVSYPVDHLLLVVNPDVGYLSANLVVRLHRGQYGPFVWAMFSQEKATERNYGVVHDGVFVLRRLFGVRDLGQSFAFPDAVAVDLMEAWTAGTAQRPLAAFAPGNAN